MSDLSEGHRKLAETYLHRAFSHNWAAHAMGLRASTPEPGIDTDLADQRKAVFLVSQLTINQMYEADMDSLVACWTEYKKAREP